MNFLIAAILDFPAKLLALVSLVWFGRRLPYISLTFIAGICFVGCLFIPRGVYPNELPIVVLSMISSFSVSASFAMLWMWTSELMPTTVRNAGVGSCSFVARIGGVIKVYKPTTQINSVLDSIYHVGSPGRNISSNPNCHVCIICTDKCHHFPFLARNSWSCTA